MMTILSVIILLVILGGLIWLTLGWLVSGLLTLMVCLGGICDMVASLAGWLSKKARTLSGYFS